MITITTGDILSNQRLVLLGDTVISSTLVLNQVKTVMTSSLNDVGQSTIRYRMYPASIISIYE